jgi:hypothetical protein
LLGIKEFSLKEPADIFRGESLRSKAFHHSMNLLLSGADSPGSGFAAGPCCYVGSRPVPDFKQTLMFELRIGLDNGAMANQNLFGEGTNAWQLVPPLEDTSIDSMSDLLH